MCTNALQAFERRARFVRAGREADKWKSVTPDMMSEEEKREDFYVRHQPEYRSQKLNSFITKLDERSERNIAVHARFKRKIGTPLKVPPPKGIPSWMVTCSDEPDNGEHDLSDLDNDDNEHNTTADSSHDSATQTESDANSTTY